MKFIKFLKKNIYYFLFLFLFTISCTILAVHFYEYYKFFTRYPNKNYPKDTLGLHVIKPGLIQKWSFSEHNYDSIRKFYNTAGFQRKSITQEKSDTPAYRILITGDSHTDGVVSTSENFCSLLEDSIKKTGSNVEVLNAGLGLYSFKDYVNVLKRNLKFKPSAFIVVYYAGNDFIENLMYDYHWYNPVRSVKIFLTRIGWRYRYPLMHNSQGPCQALYFLKNKGDMETSLRLSKTYLEEINSICNANHIAFKLLALPSFFSFNENLHAKTDSAYGFAKKDLLSERWFANKLQTFCAEKNISFYDLNNEMGKNAAKYYYQYDQHINAEGNKTVASFLFTLYKEPTFKIMNK